MTPAQENEIRIEKDYRQMAITSVERRLYLDLAEHLGKNRGTSTYVASRHLEIPCTRLRKYLRQMEKLGYVTADSNGSNNIYWSLRP